MNGALFTGPGSGVVFTGAGNGVIFTGAGNGVVFTLPEKEVSEKGIWTEPIENGVTYFVLINKTPIDYVAKVSLSWEKDKSKTV